MHFAAEQQVGRLKTASGFDYYLEQTDSGSDSGLLRAKLHWYRHNHASAEATPVSIASLEKHLERAEPYKVT